MTRWEERKVEKPADEAAPESTGKKWRTLLVVGLAGVLALGGLAAWYFLGSHGDAHAQAGELELTGDGEILAVGDFTLAVSEQKRLVKLSLGVVLKPMVDPAVVAPRIPVLKDVFIPKIMNRKARDFDSPAGLENLKRELADAAREVYPGGEIVRVLVTDLVNP